MLSLLTTRPLCIGAIYLLLIPLFGFVYYLNPYFWLNPLTFTQSWYFSVVTITTLGYGDITPQTEMARTLTSLEAVLGIVVIGFFLNAVAKSADMRREARRKAAAKDHLLIQYREWREDLVQACLRALEGGYTIDYTLEHEKELVDFRRFRDFFCGDENKHWYEVLNGMQSDEEIVEDIFLLSELFSQQVSATLGKIETENKKSLSTLTRVAQRPRLLQRLDMYRADPVKYIGLYLMEILAMWSSVSGKLDEDFVEQAIRDL
jgi:hypothetical protein